MEIYVVHYLGLEGGVMEAYPTRKIAEKQLDKLRRLRRRHNEGKCACTTDAYDAISCDGQGIQQIFGGGADAGEDGGVDVYHFPTNRKGLIAAFETGAAVVSK